MSSPASSSAGIGTNCTKQVSVVKLLDNTHGMKAEDKSIGYDRFKQLLQDPGQVDCPLLKRLGYPLILVSTTPNRKCIPAVQYPLVSNNQHNNRLATTAAARRRTGLAMGCVVGDVYALREDGQDVTSGEWWELWDFLMQLMGEFSEGGPEAVTEQLMAKYKKRLCQRMQGKGLLKSGGTGSGYQCLECGEQETDDKKLLKCAKCRVARYCSRDCQLSHWKAGHRQSCKPPVEVSEANREEQLLQTAVLKPEQIIQRNAHAPPLPRNVPAGMAQLVGLMPPDDYAIFVYNKVSKKDRFCGGCRTKYRLLENSPRNSQVDREQRLSGICSYACFRQMAAGGPTTGPDWYGQAAEKPDGVVLAM